MAALLQIKQQLQKFSPHLDETSEPRNSLLLNLDTIEMFIFQA